MKEKDIFVDYLRDDNLRAFRETIRGYFRRIRMAKESPLNGRDYVEYSHQIFQYIADVYHGIPPEARDLRSAITNELQKLILDKSSPFVDNTTEFLLSVLNTTPSHYEIKRQPTPLNGDVKVDVGRILSGRKTN